MKHIVFLLFLLSITLGIAAMIVMVLYYQKWKKPYVKYILQCDLFFLCLLFTDTVHYYISINQIVVPTLVYMIIFFGLLVFGILMIYNLFKTVHDFLAIPFPKYWFVSFWSISALFMITHLTLNILYATDTFIKYFEYPSSFMLHNIFTAIGAILNIVLLIKNRAKMQEDIRIIISIGIVIISCIVPISIIVNGMEYWIDFGLPLPFSPIIYSIVNLIALTVVLKFFFVKQEITIPNMDELLKEHLRSYDLTEREMEIINCVVVGFNNQEIANQLFISSNTVKNHIYNIYKKLEIKNRFELLNKLNQNLKSL